MVLHRPVELAPLIGMWLRWGGGNCAGNLSQSADSAFFGEIAVHLVCKRNCRVSGRQDLLGIIKGFFQLHDFCRPNRLTIALEVNEG